MTWQHIRPYARPTFEKLKVFQCILLISHAIGFGLKPDKREFVYSVELKNTLEKFEYIVQIWNKCDDYKSTHIC